MPRQPTEAVSRVHARATYSTALCGSSRGGDKSANCCVKSYFAICYADFKLSPYSEYCILHFGWFLGVWIIYSAFWKRSVYSIFMSNVSRLTQVNLLHNNLRQAKPTQAESSQVKPSLANSSQIKRSEAKPSQAKPSQAKPSQAKPSQTNRNCQLMAESCAGRNPSSPSLIAYP